jgi:hypothetical protein
MLGTAAVSCIDSKAVPMTISIVARCACCMARCSSYLTQVASKKQSGHLTRERVSALALESSRSTVAAVYVMLATLELALMSGKSGHAIFESAACFA